MAPPASHLIDAAETGRIDRFRLALRLRGTQAYFLPLPRPWALAFPRRHGADHRPVGLGNDVLGAHSGQRAKRLSIFLLQLLGGSLRMRQSRFPHRTGADLKTIVFQHPRRRVAKGMLATKIRQDPLQTNGSASRFDANGRRQQANIRLGLGAPDPFINEHLPEDAPPFQRFFLRTPAEGSCCSS